MQIPKEVRKKLINKLLVATGEPTQNQLFKRYSVSNFTKKTTTKHYRRLINSIMLKYSLQFVNIWELAKLARGAKNIKKIKKDNVKYREEIKRLKQELEEYKRKEKEEKTKKDIQKKMIV
jgi:hypothetical protein